MPILAALLKVLLANVYVLVLALKTQGLMLRLAAIGVLAAAYVACLTGFALFIAPLLSALFNTAYGQVIGLAFPPIAGTILVGIVALWGCIVVKNYFKVMLKIGVS